MEKRSIIRIDQTWAIPDNWHNAMTVACDRFAKSSAESVRFYKTSRNARDPVGDIALGKYAEIFAMQALTAYGFPSIDVDLQIYDKRQKSWAADLPYGDLGTGLPNVHVKACDDQTVGYIRNKMVNGQLVGRYSWTFNVGNGYDTAITTRGELVALVYVPSLAVRMGKLVALVATDVLPKLLKPPLSPKLRGIKKCIYETDLVEN